MSCGGNRRDQGFPFTNTFVNVPMHAVAGVTLLTASPGKSEGRKSEGSEGVEGPKGESPRGRVRGGRESFSMDD
jgi:hypothetical protein